MFELTGLTPWLMGMTLLVAALVAWYSIPIVIRVAKVKHLMDDPDGDRKFHAVRTPTLGGIAIYAALMITMPLMAGQIENSYFLSLAGGLSILFFAGLKDDILMIAPWKKLLAQLLAAFFAVWNGIYITDLGGVFGLHHVGNWVGIPLTFFTMIVVINAYNLIDGVDGLAGGIGLIASSFMAYWFYQMGQAEWTLLALVLAGSLIAFLRFNFSPASIFMGDTGSMIVGYILSLMAVHFIQMNAGGAELGTLHALAPALAIAVLIVPLFDTLRVFILRGLQRRSPFDPGRDHVHHQFLDMGLKHRGVSLILYAITVASVGMVYLLHQFDLDVNTTIGALLVFSLLVFPTRNWKRKVLGKLNITIEKRTEDVEEWNSAPPEPEREELKEEREHIMEEVA